MDRLDGFAHGICHHPSLPPVHGMPHGSPGSIVGAMMLHGWCHGACHAIDINHGVVME